MVARIANYRDSRTGPSALEMGPGASIRSTNGRFRLLYQTDGNLVLYDDVRQQPLWSSGTTGGVGTALMQLDGNFVIYGPDRVPLWSTATSGPGNYMVLQNDGNLVVYSPHGQPLWGSGTAGS